MTWLSLVAIGSLAWGQQIQWLDSIEAAKARAKTENKPILVHFGADYCGPCRSLEQYVFTEPRVAQAINDRFVAVKIDTKKQPQTVDQFQVTKIPHDVILTPDGQVAYRRMSPSSASLYQEMLSTGSRIAAETNPRSQQVVEAMSGLLQEQKVEKSQSPFYGEQAAQAGSLSSWPNNANEVVPQFNGSLPPAAVRQSASVAPEEFANGNHLTRQAPTHSLATPTYPTSDFQPPTTLPAIATPFANQLPPTQDRSLPNPSSQSIAKLPQPGQLPPAGKVRPASVPAESGGLPSLRQPSHSVNAFYHESERQVAADVNSKVPATIPNETSNLNGPQIQQVAATVNSEAAPLGLEGYCPVTLLSEKKWVKGEQEIGCYHRGVLYLFASQAAAERFMSAPDQWSPLLGGFDPIIMEQEKRLQPGKRRFGVFCETVPGQSAIVLFSNEANRDRFKQDSDRYLTLVQEITEKADRK
ncbi:MAG: thioredoxin family protein [Planctomycetaceae bacterium]|nr:thioredoxin family protein [Planctomycetaceae bacterium]